MNSIICIFSYNSFSQNLLLRKNAYRILQIWNKQFILKFSNILKIVKRHGTVWIVSNLSLKIAWKSNDFNPSRALGSGFEEICLLIFWCLPCFFFLFLSFQTHLRYCLNPFSFFYLSPLDNVPDCKLYLSDEKNQIYSKVIEYVWSLDMCRQYPNRLLFIGRKNILLYDLLLFCKKIPQIFFVYTCFFSFSLIFKSLLLFLTIS